MRNRWLNRTAIRRTAKSLHWLIVGLLVAQFIFAWTMPHIGRNTPVTTLISLHFTFGMIILAVAIVRLFWRAAHAEPAPLDGVPPWQVQSARVIHWLLYVSALRAADSRLDQRVLARHADRHVRRRTAEAGRYARARLGLDRRRAQPACLLRDADADRPARRGRPLSLFHPPRSAFSSACCRAAERQGFAITFFFQPSQVRASPWPSRSSILRASSGSM